ncbi:hypothetical protein DPMN_009047 [Dreissena polymorpha]|uniref:EGF-like domain-containing protein n=1 Tax=Dreissena polymorpha TaxID=45954 RepID=A0A9D4RXV8_DREPO|nr:hypothetical protein DPMN_009047 [Dreissena polymorpha]
MCSNGWTGSSCDDDVDECNERPGVCEDARRSCSNNMGSFSCDCLQGYEEDASGYCRDINECSDPQLNECTQTCLNAEVSYTCGCKSGYKEVNFTHCSDIDDCNLAVLNDDMETCSKVKDYCKELHNLT